MMTADSDLYGPLPMFPSLYGRVTEDRIERAVERLYDCADALLMSSKVSQAQYDAWSKAVSDWAEREYRSAFQRAYGWDRA